MWKMGGGGWVQYLDENKQLILAILDNQNLGKLNECATYQAKLQQNLMYLAAIADAQPQSVQNSSQLEVRHAGWSSTINATSTAIPAAAATHDEPKDFNSTIFATRPTCFTPSVTTFVS
jgi:hypothetical protein